MTPYEGNKILAAALNALDAAHFLIEMFKDYDYGDADKLLAINQETRLGIINVILSIEKQTEGQK